MFTIKAVKPDRQLWETACQLFFFFTVQDITNFITTEICFDDSVTFHGSSYNVGHMLKIYKLHIIHNVQFPNIRAFITTK